MQFGSDNNKKQTAVLSIWYTIKRFISSVSARYGVCIKWQSVLYLHFMLKSHLLISQNVKYGTLHSLHSFDAYCAHAKSHVRVCVCMWMLCHHKWLRHWAECDVSSCMLCFVFFFLQFIGLFVWVSVLTAERFFLYLSFTLCAFVFFFHKRSIAHHKFVLIFWNKKSTFRI